MAKAIGADTDAPLLQAINDLIPLTMMSNKKDTSFVESFRLVTVGAPTNPRLETEIAPDTHPRVAADAIITALNGLLNTELQQGKLTIRSRFDESLKYCAQLLNAYNKNEPLLKHAPAIQWEALIEQMHLSTEQGDYHGLSTLQSAVQGLQLRQQRYNTAKGNTITSEASLVASV